MNFESVVSDVKTRVSDVSNRAQNVAELSFDTVKKANGIVVPTVQNIVSKQASAARDLFESGKSSFERVRADGLKAVAANPIEYLPNGRETVFGAFSDSFELTTKAGSELAEVLRKAYEDVLARINGEVPVVRAAKKQVRSTARKASTAARKTANKASSKAKATADSIA